MRRINLRSVSKWTLLCAPSLPVLAAAAGAFLLLAGSVGCGTISLERQLQSFQKKNQQLLQDRNRLEQQLSVCRAEQAPLHDEIARVSNELRESEDEARELRATRIVRATAEARETEPTPEDTSALEEIANVTVSQSAAGTIRLTLEQAILFGAGRATLSRGGKSTLAQIAPVLAQRYRGRQVRVEGHTDNVPVAKVKKRFPSNWELSTARACAVLRELLAQGACEGELARVVGYASERPVAPNTSDEGRKRNRRVEIYILPED